MSQVELPSGKPSEFEQQAAFAIVAIGLRIREARMARNMTLQDLAALSGLSTSMLSLVERGRASPSIGSLIVISSSLKVPMSELVSSDPAIADKTVLRAGEALQTVKIGHVVRLLLREDKELGISIALNEYQPHTGSAEKPAAHPGFEHGYVLQGRLSVEIDGCTHILNQGDLISYSSKRPHRIWNNGKRVVRTLWINMAAD